MHTLLLPPHCTPPKQFTEIHEFPCKHLEVKNIKSNVLQQASEITLEDLIVHLSQSAFSTYFNSNKNQQAHKNSDRIKQLTSNLCHSRPWLPR